jgi:hypothetical protein
MLCGFLMAAAAPARGEALDDTSIRVLYAEAASNVGDPQKTRAFMEKRLDDNYIVKSNLTQVIGLDPPQDATSTFVKVDVIENALRGYALMEADRYKNLIVHIKYATDGQSAYVTDSTVSSGTISYILEGVGYRAAAYEDAESCIKQIALVEGTLKFLQGACNEKFVVK